MEKQTITIYDVAREANVSMATVSRVVNGNPNVKPATRKRVLDVIDELDYRPNAVARGLASKKTTTVGVIIPDVTNLYFASLARGIDDIATMYKYNIILANSDQNNHKEIQVLNTLLSKQVDGILYMGNHLTPELRTEIIRSKTPIVLAGTMDAEHEIASVNIDYKEATQEAVETLIENGHKKVAFVTAALKNIASVDFRLEGYKAALDKAGIKFDPKLVYEVPLTYHAGESVAERIHKAGVTAAIVTDDETSVGLLNGLIDLGIKVPEKFEIISSNNSKLTKMTRPILSTIAPPLYDIGAVAMRLLTKIMNSEEVEEHQIILPHRFIARGSTLEDKE